MFRRFAFPQFYFNTPEPGGAGGAGIAADGAQPVEGQGAPAADGFWGNFPDVPNEHRALLEPHLKGVQGHVTKLEQQFAPFKSFSEAGMTPESAQGLIQFSRDFDQDPLGMWFRIANMLQQPNDQGMSVLDPDIDLEHLAALARGEDPDAGAQQQQPPVGQELEGADPRDETIARLEARLDQFEQTNQQKELQSQQSREDQLLDRQMTGMRTALKEAGYDEELLTNEQLVSSIIAHKGNIEAATKGLLDLRGGILKGFTEARQGPGELETPDGLPSTPKNELGPRDRNDPWKKARVGAQATLRRENAAAAQS